VAEAYPWQDSLWQQLAGRSQHAHAYLLHGPAGIGKRALAERLMASLLCQRPTPEACVSANPACCSRPAATRTTTSLSPRSRQGDQGRSGPRSGQFRGADRATGRAQGGADRAGGVDEHQRRQRLAKSLEEPSGDTVLLLVSHQPSRLLPTIKSRCVQQACPLPGEAMSLQWLAQALPECSEEERIELLTLAAGSPLAAVSCSPRACASSGRRWSKG
jgi:DNA polymerase-3 subunit delta'